MLLSRCRQCKHWKNFDQFQKQKSKFKTLCLVCKRAYDRQYHSKRSQEVLERKLVLQKERLNILRQYVYNHLLSHPCVDCGEDDPVVLEFDHLGNKVRSVSQMVVDGVSVQKLQTEIEKCEVRCANCHRRKTANDFNWWIAKQ